MNCDTALDVLQALAIAPRTTEQLVRATRRSLSRTQAAVLALRRRGLVYIADEIPPIVGKPIPIYAIQPGLKAWAMADCRLWAGLPPHERWARRVEHYGEDVLEREAEKRYEKCRATRSRTGSRPGPTEAKRPAASGTAPCLRLGDAAPGV